MRIVHINATDVGGGAAIACVRHCEAMLEAGLDSSMLVVKKSGSKAFVNEYYHGWKKIIPIVLNKQSALDSVSLTLSGRFSPDTLDETLSKIEQS